MLRVGAEIAAQQVGRLSSRLGGRHCCPRQDSDSLAHLLLAAGPVAPIWWSPRLSWWWWSWSSSLGTRPLVDRWGELAVRAPTAGRAQGTKVSSAGHFCARRSVWRCGRPNGLAASRAQTQQVASERLAGSSGGSSGATFAPAGHAHPSRGPSGWPYVN